VPSVRLALAAPLLLVPLVGVARGQPADTLRGRLDGRPAAAVVTAPADDPGARRIRIDARWTGRLEPAGRFVWRGPVEAAAPAAGLADRVRSPEAEPGPAPAGVLTVRYVAVPGLRPRAHFERDGRAVGLLRAERPPEPLEARPVAPAPSDAAAEAPRFADFDGALGEEPVPGECAPRRDAWWARHAVATWGGLRAMWDFFRPGSRRYEELRGDTTPADARALRADLEGAEAAPPWSAATIFRTAQARTASDREALQLAFGLVHDHPDLDLRRLPGLAPDVPLHDKLAHFFGSAILAHRSNARGSFALGWVKEVLDEVAPGGNGYSEDDLLADALGADFGQTLHCGEVLDY